MKKTILLLALSFILINCYPQEYMDKIVRQSCECVEMVSDTLKLEQYNIQLGLCMLEASMPYKTELMNDYNVDLDNIDTEGEKLGRIIGLKMVSVCPKALTKMANIVSDNKNKINKDNDGELTGVITNIGSDNFVIFSVKDDDGKITKMYWLNFIESSVELTANYGSLKGRSVQIIYKKEDFFDPRIEQYRQFCIIKNIKLI